MSGPSSAAALGGILALMWFTVSFVRRSRLASRARRGSRARDGLRQFAEQSLTLESVGEILAFAGEAAGLIFGTARVVGFERGSTEGAWEAAEPGKTHLGEVPVALRSLFGWFRHNPMTAVDSDLGDPRLGAMRGPLRQAMNRYQVDVLLPLVHESQILGVLGLALGRSPSESDRELMRLFRLQATAACANVRLHVEAAHMVSLAKEVDLAGAVKLALVPDEMEGERSDLRWAGYYQAVSGSGSDFWGVYPLSDHEVMVIIGDAVGAGLAGSLVSAVVKSCADVIFDQGPRHISPVRLLGAMNRSLYRSHNAVHTSAFALLIDRRSGTVTHSNAGHPFPYHLQPNGLGVLSGSGPLLGDDATSAYTELQTKTANHSFLVMFTDGLVKANDTAGQAYGERRLQKVLKSQAPDSAVGLRDAILSSIDAHRGPVERNDDAALLVLELR